MMISVCNCDLGVGLFLTPQDIQRSTTRGVEDINWGLNPPPPAIPTLSRDRPKPPFSFVRGHDSTMWDIVWVSPQEHRSVCVSRHFLLQAPQCPCFVRKRFNKDHCCRGRSKPGCRIMRSHTKWELTTWADFQLCLHRLLMSTGCKSSHSGFLCVSCSNGGLRISGWIGQLSCLTIFSTSLSVAAFLRRSGGSMLESTGSHGRGVERRVSEMRRMVEFNCTPTWPVSD